MIEKEGYPYAFDPTACEACGGRCCRGESGYIWVKYTEAQNIATFVNLSLEEFATMYLKKVNHRYSLREKRLGENDMACVFFDEKAERCMIYPVRPMQCRTFPFWESVTCDLDGLQNECPGVIVCKEERL